MRPGQDVPVVRVASARVGLQLYAAYINWNCDRAGDMDVMGVVVVRDDNLGRNNFRNLGAGGNGQLVMGADTRLPNRPGPHAGATGLRRVQAGQGILTAEQTATRISEPRRPPGTAGPGPRV